ncbi:MAG: hypothetical protein ABFD64_12585 [Armatimonadota bacterium]
MRNLVLICLVLSVMSVSAAQAGLGRVVYLHSADLAKSSADGALAPRSGRVDLVETDLSLGKRSILINGFFNGALEDFSDASIAVSHDGRYIAIGQNSTITISEGDSPGEPTITRIPKGLRLWDRKTRQVKVIYSGFTNDQLLWSGSDRYLAIIDPYSEGPVRIYDAVAGRMRAYSGYSELTCVAWSAKRDEIILVLPAEKGSVVYAQPVIGRRRVLFKWHDSIDEIAEFGNNSGYALCDGIGVLLYKPGGMTKRLSVNRSHNDPWDVILQPQLNGSWMAALSSYSYGEPHINDDKALYVFRFNGSAFQRIAKWSTSYLSIQPNGGSIMLMETAGWLGDISKVVLRGQAIWGGEAVVDNRRDRFVFWTFDVSGGRTGKKIFDTGPGCLSAVWWPG